MKIRKSSGNVFADIGFGEAEADELAVKSDLITLLMRAMRQRGLTQRQAALLCGIDQGTLSKVLRGPAGKRVDRSACPMAGGARQRRHHQGAEAETASRRLSRLAERACSGIGEPDRRLRLQSVARDHDTIVLSDDGLLIVTGYRTRRLRRP